ncbi:Leucine rich repeat-containing protein [Prevotella communis]|uniref:Leucine rich repeat-containing protein n=2 Tax=Prevotella communis TaxID=2913614 RepID=A0A1H0FW09_9BACT|nr:Leucine rich repeat-containing protein [Prevotella communis]
MKGNFFMTKQLLSKQNRETSSSIITILWKCSHMCVMLMGILMICGLSSCSKDDGDAEEQVSEENVVVDNNGVASGGHSFTRIDDKNFYIDDIKYTVVDSVLEVTGYDETFFKGKANIINSLDYHGTLLEVRSIGESAFNSCYALISVIIPKNVITIKSEAFRDCKGLNSISFKGEGLTSIGGSAFRGCTSISAFIIPNSVTSIGRCVFSGCTSLTSLKVGSKNSMYDSRDNCNAIIETRSNTLIQGCNSSTIPNSVTSIGSGSFSGCTSLTSITIPNSVTTIAPISFSDCDALTSVTIGKNVESIDFTAFENCRSLTTVTINSNSIMSKIDNYNYIAHMFGSQVTHYIIGDEVTSIVEQAFYGCKELTTINISNSVTSIGDHAFFRCKNLSEVVIGNAVTYIGFSIFSQCSSLTDVYCYAENAPYTESDLFGNTNIINGTLHVPLASIELYKTAKSWNKFKNIVALTDNDPRP